MKHIGLIGGIGPAATDYYYRGLIERSAVAGQSLDVTIVHADAPILLQNLTDNAFANQVAIYQRLAKRLALAGADSVVVTSIAGHFCIDAFKEISPLPVIDMLQAVNQSVATQGLKRIGILGTQTVMANRFYGAIEAAEVIPPQGDMLAAVHNAYVEMAKTGQVSDAQKQVFDAACAVFFKHDNVDAVMLGGTDLALVYTEQTAPFPILDCAAIHIDAVYDDACAT